jgi:hypothetical protein
MKEFIEWFNGKKTIIGAIATATVGYAYNEMWIDNYTATYLAIVSGILFGAGAAHKAVKFRKKSK